MHVVLQGNVRPSARDEARNGIGVSDVGRYVYCNHAQLFQRTLRVLTEKVRRRHKVLCQPPVRIARQQPRHPIAHAHVLDV